MDTSSGWSATDNKVEASMSQNVVYVGIDLDDVRYHERALDSRTGEALEFQCRPTLKGLVGQLEKIQGIRWRRSLEAMLQSALRGFLAAARPACAGLRP